MIQVERNRLQRQLAGFDARIVEHVVDYAQQGIGRGQHFFLIIALLRVEPGFQQQFAQTDDGVHWRANFMAHARQKVGFGAIGLIRLCRGNGELVRTLLDQLFEILSILRQLLVARLQRIDHFVPALPEPGDLIVATNAKTFLQGSVSRHARHQSAQHLQRCRQPAYQVSRQPERQAERDEQDQSALDRRAQQCGLHHLQRSGQFDGRRHLLITGNRRPYRHQTLSHIRFFQHRVGQERDGRSLGA